MRFKTYGLYLRSSLILDNEDDGTWCQIEFPLFEDHQSNILSLDIRLNKFLKKGKFSFFYCLDYVQQRSIMQI